MDFCSLWFYGSGLTVYLCKNKKKHFMFSFCSLLTLMLMCVSERDRDRVSINALQNLYHHTCQADVSVWDESSNLAAATSGGFLTLVFDAAGEAIRPVSRVYCVHTFPEDYETSVLTSHEHLKSGLM